VNDLQIIICCILILACGVAAAVIIRNALDSRFGSRWTDQDGNAV
jgi:hypothetical protein